MSEQAKQIYDRMFKKRIAHGALKSWTGRSVLSIRPTKPLEFIQQQLDEGFKVKAGWYATAIRGYHDYWIFWKQ